MAHTPGPWRFEKDGHEPYWNVDMPMQDGSPGYGYANAMVYTTADDARLIAAAPELLSALKALSDIVGTELQEDPNADDLTGIRRAFDVACAAIAKATEQESE